ncbi:MAG: alpha/beta hydrolase [Nevskiaceae bacterium]|nr:MAG: alpha/beta hydrolase [Nevskiaceae bacterium]
MAIAKINGQAIRYEDSGGSGPVVVFSHGLLMDGSMFAPQVATLRTRYRVVTWDERGHGGTNDAAAPFSYYDSANDLVALLDHLGIDRAVFGGMSQGGYLSLRAALRHPQRVRALILIDTQARPEDPATLPLYTQLVQNWAANGLDDQTAATIEHIILGTGYADAPTWKAKWKQVRGANLLQIFNTLVTRDDISDAIAAIKVPALVVHGTADAAIPLTHAQEMATRLHAELVAVPGAGHAANLTHPEIVNPAIERFLAAL